MEPQTVNEVQHARVPVLKKLQAIMTDVAFIEKDKQNQFHGYAYASEEAIKKAIHTSLVKHGVVFSLSVSSPRIITWEDTKTKTSLNMTVVDCQYTFMDVDTGSTLDGEFVGSGSGRDDKGVYAAITGAIKYILTSTLLIPTGMDPEADGAKPKAPATRTYPLKNTPTPTAPKPTTPSTPETPASPRQKELIGTLCFERGQSNIDTTNMSSFTAKQTIEKLMAMPKKSA